jgi:hypothetical protein
MHRQVIEIQTRDVLNRPRRRPIVKQKRFEDTCLWLAPELA